MSCLKYLGYPMNPKKYFCIFWDSKSSPRSVDFGGLLKTPKIKKYIN